MENMNLAAIILSSLMGNLSEAEAAPEHTTRPLTQQEQHQAAAPRPEEPALHAAPQQPDAAASDPAPAEATPR